MPIRKVRKHALDSSDESDSDAPAARDDSTKRAKAARHSDPDSDSESAQDSGSESSQSSGSNPYKDPVKIPVPNAIEIPVPNAIEIPNPVRTTTTPIR